ncbi:hypothetical protein C8R48DRAFT_776148 [Suillus tomentosus]|nr:hypothetical protein C8R48DRAFT_776148 [Suillus tomentosus]
MDRAWFKPSSNRKKLPGFCRIVEVCALILPSMIHFGLRDSQVSRFTWFAQMQRLVNALTSSHRIRLLALFPHLRPNAVVHDLAHAHRDSTGLLVYGAPVQNHPWERIENLDARSETMPLYRSNCSGRRPRAIIWSAMCKMKSVAYQRDKKRTPTFVLEAWCRRWGRRAGDSAYCRSPGREGRRLLRHLGDRSARYVVVQGRSRAIGLPFLLSLGLIVGSAGAMLTNISANIAISRATPPSVAGIVWAMFNCGLQLGSAVGLAAVRSIQASVQTGNGGPSNYEGQSAGFWFILACISVAVLAVWVFYHADTARDYV